MKTIKQFLLLAAIGMLLTTTSCIDGFTIHGNGNEGTENRIISDFDKLKSSGSFDVNVSYGDEYEVIVIAETNIIPYIETYVSNGTLHLDIRGLHNIKNHLPMQVHITTPQMRSIKQSGSGEITTSYFEANEFEMFISGSGSITTSVDAARINAGISGSGKLIVTGTASETNFSISGSGRINGYELYSQDCDAFISGSGNMYISANHSIHATISGSGNVFYKGDPNIDAHVSGSGKIISRN